MIFNRKNLLVATAVGTGEQYRGGDPELHLTDKFTEVTNGHYAVRVPAPANGDQSLDVPVSKEHRPFRKKRFEAVVGIDVAKDVLREMDRTKGNRQMAIMGLTWIGQGTDDKKVEFLVMDKNVEIKAVVGKKSEAKYPNITNVIKAMKGKPKIQFALDAKYIKMLADLFIRAGEKAVCFTVWNDKKAIKLESVSSTEQGILAVIMPISADLPDWRKPKRVKPAVGPAPDAAAADEEKTEAGEEPGVES